MRLNRRFFHYLFLAVAIVLLWKAAYIHAKAQLAQWLLASAWQQTLQQHQPHKPWPWADVYPVARLVLARKNVDYIVLNSHAGEAMAFGPGAEIYRDEITGEEHWVIGGHRDTHFHFLKNVSVGDVMTLYTLTGQTLRYRISATQIVDSSKQRLQLAELHAGLLLVTCYPFDSVEVGGPLRYLVSAALIPEGEKI